MTYVAGPCRPVIVRRQEMLRGELWRWNSRITGSRSVVVVVQTQPGKACSKIRGRCGNPGGQANGERSFLRSSINVTSVPDLTSVLVGDQNGHVSWTVRNYR